MGRNFLNYDVFLSLRVVLNLANSADPDKMLYAAFHVGLHCLLKYPFRGFQYTNDLRVERHNMINPLDNGY